MRTLLLLMVAAAQFAVAGSAMAVEEAEFAVVARDGDFEIRDYAAQIVAEVLVDDEFEEAGSRAFRKLFKYISGANTAREEIAMTSPVSQEKRSEKIAMTSPVGQRSSGDAWAVSFMMPAAYTMETTPSPDDPEVVIREIPPHRMAAVRYSGRWTEKNYQQHLGELRAWVAARNLEVMGDPVWARYNPPFTPWFMRRNEILLPVSGGEPSSAGHAGSD